MGSSIKMGVQEQKNEGEKRVFGDHGSLSVIRYSMIGLFPDFEEKKIVHIYLSVYIYLYVDIVWR